MKKNRILIIKPSSIGDIFHVFPGLVAFKEKYPNCEIHWLVDERFESAVKLFSSNIVIHSVNRRKLKIFSHIFGGWACRYFLKKIGQFKFDYILDLSFRASDVDAVKYLNSSICGLSKKALDQLTGEVLITNSEVSGHYDNAVDLPSGWEEIEFKTLPYVNLYKFLLLESGKSYLDESVELAAPEEKKNPVVRVLNSCDKIKKENYCLFFHSSSGTVKNWKLEYWSELAVMMQAKGIQVCLPWGSSAEKARAEAIAKDNSSCYVMPKLSIEELTYWIQCSQFVIGCDTGFTHLASLCNKPVIQIWGPITKNAGIPSQNSRDLVSEMDCAPCGKTNYCKMLGGEKNIDPPCYNSMPPHKVMDLLAEVMS